MIVSPIEMYIVFEDFDSNEILWLSCLPRVSLMFAVSFIMFRLAYTNGSYISDKCLSVATSSELKPKCDANVKTFMSRPF